MGRDKERLEEVEKICKEKGANVFVLQCDVRDKDRMEELITKADDESPVLSFKFDCLQIDLVIANAAVMIPECGKTEDIAIVSKLFNDNVQVTREIFAINVDGVFNTIFPLLSRMQSRRRGQIAIVSSTAGLCSEPMNPLYSSSKVAITSFGEALRWIMRDYNVYVNVITPAAVDTPMTDVPIVKNMPGHFASPEAMARVIRKGLQRDFMHVAHTAMDYWSCCVGMRDVPAAARDYYFRMLTPLVKKTGNYLIEFHPASKELIVC